MLETVAVGKLSVDAYRGVAPDSVLDELERRAGQLSGARVLHLNATPYGGGVSELLRSSIPLLNDLGLVADWQVIGGDPKFFEVTKRLHNGLQGAPSVLDESDRTTYLAAARRNAAALEDERYDFVFVHDPQPAAIPALRPGASERWIWRCHIDTSAPDPDAWEFIRPFLGRYDAAVFTLPGFLPRDFPVAHVDVIPPAIDPLSPKNVRLPDAIRDQVLSWIGVRLDRPMICQVSRFDPWKDPLGVIDAYRLVRAEVPGLQLVLAGSMALDDPEGWEIYRQVGAAADDDPDILVMTNLTGVGNIEVNALQDAAQVVVQKSIREGFGLVVSEALWKGTPVVAGRAGGIPLQMADDSGGRLVDDVGGCARALIELLRDRERAGALAERGRQRVREHFLLPRLVLNELELMAELVGARPLGVRLSQDRDPVCGMAIADPSHAPEAQYHGIEYRFCSLACRARFEADPQRYLRALAGAEA